MAFKSPKNPTKVRRPLPDLPADCLLSNSVTFSTNAMEMSVSKAHTISKVKEVDKLAELCCSDENHDQHTIYQDIEVPVKFCEANKHVDVELTQTCDFLPDNIENKKIDYTERDKELSGLKTPTIGGVRRNAHSAKNSHLQSSYDDAYHQLVEPIQEMAFTANEKRETSKVIIVPCITSSKYLNEVSDQNSVTPTTCQLRRHTLETKMFETPDCYRVVKMGTPHKRFFDGSHSAAGELLADCDEDSEDNCSITVAVRVRPFNQRELADPNVKQVVSMRANETTVTINNGTTYCFAYDFSFWSFDHTADQYADQKQVYRCLAQPLLQKAFDGYNTCLFAYGQTGSGKSYSVMGHCEQSGIIPRFCEELFSRCNRVNMDCNAKIMVEISFFEIYNEKIHDLLASVKEKGGKKATLRVREHPVLGPYVEGLSTFVVNTYEDVQGWITLGNRRRATAATGMNDKSSRSHSVFSIVLTQTRVEVIDRQHQQEEELDQSVTSKINLVDLAGSERQVQAQTSGERLREGVNINKSLLTLGKVISMLSQRSSASKKRHFFVPYRDSILTWLLKESLGGNSKTAMLATISPSCFHVEETLSTLRYAYQTRSIVNKARVNEDPKARLIRELRAEIEKLHRQAGNIRGGDHPLIDCTENAMLRQQLRLKEKEIMELSRSRTERLQQAESQKTEESRHLEMSGVTLSASQIDNHLPNLVNLNEDPQLSELLLFVLRSGQTGVGRSREDALHNIHLNGALIAENHWFNHPDQVESKEHDSESTSAAVKDFEFAKQELFEVQEARMQGQLEESGIISQPSDVDGTSVRQEVQNDLCHQYSGYKVCLTSMQEMLPARDGIHKSHICQLLEEECRKCYGRLNELRQRHAAEVGTPTKLMRVGCSRQQLYRVAVLLREANQISQQLHLDTVLSRHDNDVDTPDGVVTETRIKVLNLRHRILTYWTVAKLEMKLVQMRDMYQSEGSITAAAAELDDAFLDPDDDWVKDSVSAFQSPIISSWLRSSPPPRLSYGRSGDTVTVFSPQASVLSPLDVSKETAVYRACQEMVSHCLESVNDGFEDGVFTRILLDCNGLRRMMTSCGIHQEVDLSDDVSDTGSWTQWSAIQLSSHIQSLAAHCRAVTAIFHGRGRPIVCEPVCSGLLEGVHCAGKQALHLLKVYKSRCRSLVCDAAVRLDNDILSICQICGHLALAVDLSTVSSPLGRGVYGVVGPDFDECPEVCRAFFVGCYDYADTVFQRNVRRLEECHEHLQEVLRAVPAGQDMTAVCGALSDTLMKAKHFVQACQEAETSIGQKLSTLFTDQGHSTPNELWLWVQSHVCYVSSLTESAERLFVLAKGLTNRAEVHDWQAFAQCVDFIHHLAWRILCSYREPDPSVDTETFVASHREPEPSVDTETFVASHRFTCLPNVDNVRIKLSMPPFTVMSTQHLDRPGKDYPGCFKLLGCDNDVVLLASKRLVLSVLSLGEHVGHMISHS